MFTAKRVVAFWAMVVWIVAIGFVAGYWTAAAYYDRPPEVVPTVYERRIPAAPVSIAGAGHEGYVRYDDGR